MFPGGELAVRQQCLSPSGDPEPGKQRGRSCTQASQTAPLTAHVKHTDKPHITSQHCPGSQGLRIYTGFAQDLYVWCIWAVYVTLHGLVFRDLIVVHAGILQTLVSDLDDNEK